MVLQVRSQFNTIPGLMEGTARPDYRRCVEISTQVRPGFDWSDDYRDESAMTQRCSARKHTALCVRAAGRGRWFPCLRSWAWRRAV